MAIVSLTELEEKPDPDVKLSAQGRTPLPVAYVETEVDLERERKALTFSTKARTRGYEMYLDGHTPPEIAKAMGVGADTILAWARDGGWAARMKHRNDSNERLVRENVRRIRLKRVEEDVESSLKLGRRIREVVHQRLEKPENLRTQDIKNLADAGKASADTSAQGMGDSSEAEAAGKDARRPLVIVFQDGLPPKREPKTVEGEAL